MDGIKNIMPHLTVIWTAIVMVVSGTRYLDAPVSRCELVSVFGRQTLDCTSRSIEHLQEIKSSLDVTSKHIDISVMLLSHNNLTTVTRDSFIKYHKSLQEISLRHNYIDVVEEGALTNLLNLHVLDISFNLLQTITNEIFTGLASLRILRISHNPLTFVHPGAFQHLSSLEELDLEGGLLTVINAELFKTLPSLVSLNLANNRLERMEGKSCVRGVECFPLSLNVVRLYGNDWDCDCRMRWVRFWLENVQINWNFGHNTPVCRMPELLSGIGWHSLSVKQFACPALILSTSGAVFTSVQSGADECLPVCVAHGFPVPTVTWYKEGKRVGGLSHGAVINEKRSAEEMFGSELTGLNIRSCIQFRNISKSDSGEYKCVANNSAGRAEVVFHVSVNSSVASASESRTEQSAVPVLLVIGLVVGSFIVCAILVLLLILLVRYMRGNRLYAYNVHEQHIKGIVSDSSSEEHDASPNLEYNKITNTTSPSFVLSANDRIDRNNSMRVNTEIGLPLSYLAERWEGDPDMRGYVAAEAVDEYSRDIVFYSDLFHKNAFLKTPINFDLYSPEQNRMNAGSMQGNLSTLNNEEITQSESIINEQFNTPDLLNNSNKKLSGYPCSMPRCDVLSPGLSRDLESLYRGLTGGLETNDFCYKADRPIGPESDKMFTTQQSTPLKLTREQVNTWKNMARASVQDYSVPTDSNHKLRVPNKITRKPSAAEAAAAAFAAEYDPSTRRKILEDSLRTRESLECTRINGNFAASDSNKFLSNNVSPSNMLGYDYLHDMPISDDKFKYKKQPPFEYIAETGNRLSSDLSLMVPSGSETDVKLGFSLLSQSPVRHSGSVTGYTENTNHLPVELSATNTRNCNANTNNNRGTYDLADQLDARRQEYADYCVTMGPPKPARTYLHRPTLSPSTNVSLLDTDNCYNTHL